MPRGAETNLDLGVARVEQLCSELANSLAPGGSRVAKPGHVLLAGTLLPVGALKLKQPPGRGPQRILASLDVLQMSRPPS
jgi:hypothetical protein